MFFLRDLLHRKYVHHVQYKDKLKIVPLNNLNKYLHYNAGETEVNLSISANNGSEKIIK
jgi:hypothetical protein